MNGPSTPGFGSYPTLLDVGGATVTNRFEVRSLLGEGAMGRVYRAFDQVFGREVALKTLRLGGADEVYQLKKEFRALRDLGHPNVVQLHELVVEGERNFFTMELVEGRHFLDWVWNQELPDLRRPLSEEGAQRLRDGLSQLVLGVAVLHASAHLHRDIKPSNVLVDTRGRVVLVDVGLASNLKSWQSQRSRIGKLVGTLDYMAPEQSLGGQLDEAADWYSVGVILFEALSGTVPNGQMGQLSRLMGDSRDQLILPPGTPDDLAKLALELLAHDPRQRPTYAQIAARLGMPLPESQALVPSGAKLVGREPELKQLLESFQSTRAGSGTTIHVVGPSGFGKSALVESFASILERDHGAWVLRAQCHYREHLPFNALDGIIDALSRYLNELSADELVGVLPEDATALLQVFPLLHRVDLLRQGWDSSGQTLGLKTRQRAFRAFRDLLARVAAERPLVLWIDDLQWTDNDSVALLQVLSRANCRPGWMTIFGYRPPTEDSPTAFRRVTKREWGGERVLPLEPLSREATEQLIRGFRFDSDPDRLGALAAAAAGVPLVAYELCWQLRTSPDSHTPEDFDRLILARIGRLPESSRYILDALAVAAYPVEQALLSELANPSTSVDAALGPLRYEKLARLVSKRNRVCLEVTHDRIREIVAAGVSAERAAQFHSALAEALVRSKEIEPNLLVDHLLSAGNRSEAVTYALEAAHQASACTAFGRAASLYQRALECGVPPAQRWSVRRSLATALAAIGRGKAAAEQFTLAGQELAEQDASSLEVIRLRAAAAERLMLSGFVAEGIERMNETLVSVGAPYARTPKVALVRSLATMPRASLARKRWQKRRNLSRSASETPADQARLRLDVTWAAGLALGWLDPMRAMELQVRHAVWAYELNDAAHIARSLCVDALIQAMQGGRARWLKSAEKQAEARLLGEQSRDAGALALLRVYSAATDYFQARWQSASRLAMEGYELCNSSGVGMAWETSFAQWLCLTCSVYLGEVLQAREQLPDLLGEAESRNDRYAMSTHRLGWINLLWLIDDDSERARSEAEKAFEPFASDKFGTVHYLYLMASANIELYLRNPVRAQQLLESSWLGLKQSYQLRLATVATEMWDLRGRSSLGVALAEGATRRDQESALSLVRQAIHALGKGPLPSAAPKAQVLRAGLHAAQKNWDVACDQLQRAAIGFEALQMQMHAAACRYKIGTLSNENRSIGWFDDQQVANPDRLASVLVPISL